MSSEVVSNRGSAAHEGAVNCNQFHQHFTSSFCANSLLPKKLQSQTASAEKLRKALLYKKVARKMLMKLTPGFVLLSHLELRVPA